ncbi:MAG TPA: acVLRF1 family peptidyl-tRNA hydrolase [Trebonia sp.]|nr:acVLRF1 family peptidyl-tRNA hydrolase [Trebonia sp.]
MKGDSGGGRWIEVSPVRFPGWIGDFGTRHGATREAPLAMAASRAGGAAGEVSVIFVAPDGALARCHPPFPGYSEQIGLVASESASAIAAHALAHRTVGVLLVRLGGYAVGVFTGLPPRLASSKVGTRPVHGRSAAGGWSQQRFARRRENQAATALQAAADAAAEVFGRYGPGGLDAVVLGGDKRSAAGLRGDARLAQYLARASGRFLTVPDPRLAVLRETPRAFLAFRIRLTEPESVGPARG